MTEADVEQALGIAKPKKVELVPAVAGEAAAPLGSVPMTGMQQAIAKNMEATLSVPVFRVTKTVATDAFDALYQKLKPDGVTVSALLAKACAIALVKTPLINAAYGASGTIDYNDHVNVAQAVALDGGLITPTLRDADKLSLTDLSAAWKDLVGKARSGSLKPGGVPDRYFYDKQPGDVRRGPVRRHPAAGPRGDIGHRVQQGRAHPHARRGSRCGAPEADDGDDHVRPPHHLGRRRGGLPQGLRGGRREPPVPGLPSHRWRSP